MKKYIQQISALLAALNSEAKNRQTTLANATSELATATKALCAEIAEKPDNRKQLVELKKMGDSAITLALPHLKRGQEQDVAQRLGGDFRGLKINSNGINHMYARLDG